MRIRRSPAVASVAVLALSLLLAPPLPARQDPQAPPALTKEERRQFLLTAKVTRVRDLSKGVTRPRRLTLTDGRLTHDAVFQSINERRGQAAFDRGGGEVNFVDSALYNLAAYEPAELRELDHMMPVTVPYRYQGRAGSLSWWIHWKWDEGMRRAQKLSPPDPQDWNHQTYRMRVFAQLVHDTDRNLGNILITEDWKLYMVDFTRAFRLHRQLQSPADLQRCDRRLLARLRALDPAEVTTRLKAYLTRFEIDALLARRDLLVAHFDAVFADRGEAAVLD